MTPRRALRVRAVHLDFDKLAFRQVTIWVLHSTPRPCHRSQRSSSMPKPSRPSILSVVGQFHGRPTSCSHRSPQSTLRHGLTSRSSPQNFLLHRPSSPSNNANTIPCSECFSNASSFAEILESYSCSLVRGTNWIIFLTTYNNRTQPVISMVRE